MKSIDTSCAPNAIDIGEFNNLESLNMYQATTLKKATNIVIDCPSQPLKRLSIALVSNSGENETKQRNPYKNQDAEITKLYAM